jgi:chemotaxis protein methyltransferase CheR
MNGTAPLDPDVAAVLRLLGERTGLHFDPGRRATAAAGVRRALVRAGAASCADYLSLLQGDAQVFDDLVVDLTVGETYFFREPAHFDLVRREVLPDVRRRRSEGHVCRAWSSGCASGEEAYSLAILLAEEWAGGPAYLLATDISRAALARAARARYGDWSLRGEGAARAGPYLDHRGQHHVVHERLRRCVTFEYLNLALDVYPSFATGAWGMDLILCRNVLIYFDRETVGRVARRLFETLAPGGWLITASSDPPLASEAPYTSVLTPAGVVYRRPEAPVWTPRPPPRGPESPPRSEEKPRRPEPQPAPAPVPALPADVLAEARQAFAAGAYGRAAELTAGLLADPAAAILQVRALANLDPARAEASCAEAAARHALSTELHYLHGVLLLELGRDQEAERALRRALYLDRSLAVAHLTLGALAARHGDREAARRAYRNARDLCTARPADEAVPLAEGEPAGRLAAAAAAALAVLDTAPEAES